MAGSVRVVLKPTNKQSSIDCHYSDEFAKDFVGLIKSGYSTDDLNRYSEKYDKNIIKKYSDLVKFLNDEKLSLGLGWYNNNTDTTVKEFIDKKDTNQILTNLLSFKFDNKEEIISIGRFYSINTKTGSYSVESEEGDDFVSSGIFDNDRKEFSITLSFSKTYKVIIQRYTLETVGGKKKTKDTIVSFIEHEVID